MFGINQSKFKGRRFILGLVILGDALVRILSLGYFVTDWALSFIQTELQELNKSI